MYNLVKLHIPGNELRVVSGQLLGDYLSSEFGARVRLTWLDISDNQLRAAGIVAIVKSLINARDAGRPTMLTHLNCCGNWIDDEGADALCQLLSGRGQYIAPGDKGIASKELKKKKKGRGRKTVCSIRSLDVRGEQFSAVSKY